MGWVKGSNWKVTDMSQKSHLFMFTCHIHVIIIPLGSVWRKERLKSHDQCQKNNSSTMSNESGLFTNNVGGFVYTEPASCGDRPVAWVDVKDVLWAEVPPCLFHTSWIHFPKSV